MDDIDKGKEEEETMSQKQMMKLITQMNARMEEMEKKSASEMKKLRHENEQLKKELAMKDSGRVTSESSSVKSRMSQIIRRESVVHDIPPIEKYPQLKTRVSHEENSNEVNDSIEESVDINEDDPYSVDDNEYKQLLNPYLDRSGTPKLSKPEKYDGKRIGVEAELWLNSIQTFVLTNKYDHRSALDFAVSYLTGTARIWWSSVRDGLQSSEIPRLGFMAFKRSFLAQYCPMDNADHFRKRLEKLSLEECGSVRKYITQFNTIAGNIRKSEVTDSELQYYFKGGLNFQLKSAIVASSPKTLLDWQDKARELSDIGGVEIKKDNKRQVGKNYNSNNSGSGRKDNGNNNNKGSRAGSGSGSGSNSGSVSAFGSGSGKANVGGGKKDNEDKNKML